VSKSEFWVEHPEAELLMREMFEDGFTMSQIGAVIGCSRNAVIGKVHRLGLERFVPRATPLLRQPQATRRARSPRPPPPPPKPLLVEVEAPTAEHAHKQITELQHGDCRWPVGEPADFCFCAEPQRWDSSYCAYHDDLSRERKRR
jgi:GcrA cell cycle regulator